MAITITASDDALSKKNEQNVPPSSQRFQAVKSLCDQGLYAGVIMMPVLPFIQDSPENIKKMVQLAYEHNAKFIFTLPHFGVTLRANQRDWYYDKLDLLFPGT